MGLGDWQAACKMALRAELNCIVLHLGHQTPVRFVKAQPQESPARESWDLPEHRFQQTSPELTKQSRYPVNARMVRLLNIRTMKLETHHNIEGAPPYAVLSHTWTQGLPGQEPEILFDDWNPDLQQKLLHDMQDGDLPKMWERHEPGRKLLGFLKKARSLGMEYAWVDTVCIDKSVRGARFCMMFSVIPQKADFKSPRRNYPKPSTPCGGSIDRQQSALPSCRTLFMPLKLSGGV